jgi:hypothetical protein
MKTPAPLKAWAPIIRNARSTWIYHLAIRRTRSAARVAYLDGWDQNAERNLRRDQRNGRVRFAKVLVTLATCLVFALVVRADEPKPILTGTTNLPGTIVPPAFDHAPIDPKAPLAFGPLQMPPSLTLHAATSVVFSGYEPGQEIRIDLKTGKVTVKGFQDLDEATLLFWKRIEQVFHKFNRPQP